MRGNVYPMPMGKGVLLRKPKIDMPDVVSLIVSLAASDSKYANIYAHKYGLSARLLLFILNRSGYEIRHSKIYLSN